MNRNFYEKYCFSKIVEKHAIPLTKTLGNGVVINVTKAGKGGYIVFSVDTMKVKMRKARQTAYIGNNFRCGCCHHDATHYSIEKDNPDNRYWTSKLYRINNEDNTPWLYSIDEEYGLLCEKCMKVNVEKKRAAKYMVQRVDEQFDCEEDEVDDVDEDVNVTGVSILSRQQEEIFVDGIPIGYVLLNEDGVTFRAEIYDNYLHTKEDVTMLRKFIEVVDKYTWVED